MKRKTKIKMQIVFLLICVTFIFLSNPFIKGFCSYCFSSYNIRAIENEAEIDCWNQKLRQDYKDAQEKKKNIIIKYDSARWCFDSGKTITGRVARIFIIICFFAIYFWILYMIVNIIKNDIFFILNRN